MKNSQTAIIKSKKSLVVANLALVIAAVTLGFSAIFVRWANAPGAVSSFYRMAIAVVILGWPFYRGLKANRPPDKTGVRFAVLGGLFFAADLASWATGVVLGGATNPTLLANTAPIWVGLGAMLIFREKLSLAFWGGLILASGGAAFILGLDTMQAANLGLASLYGLIAAFFYGAYFLFTQRGRETLDALTYFWIAAVTSTLALLILSFVLRQPLTGYSSFTYLNFLAMGLTTQVIGYLAINYALGYLPASLVAPTLLAQPVITALLAGPLLGEPITLAQAGGGVAVLAGVIIVHLSRQNKDNS
ncbi:MAG: DMT family transporter [Chloroflexi bacterium]|nr:DMT family transporter [Chloroflexota bacterium]